MAGPGHQRPPSYLRRRKKAQYDVCQGQQAASGGKHMYISRCVVLPQTRLPHHDGSLLFHLLCTHTHDTVGASEYNWKHLSGRGVFHVQCVLYSFPPMDNINTSIKPRGLSYHKKKKNECIPQVVFSPNTPQQPRHIHHSDGLHFARPPGEALIALWQRWGGGWRAGCIGWWQLVPPLTHTDTHAAGATTLEGNLILLERHDNLRLSQDNPTGTPISTGTTTQVEHSLPLGRHPNLRLSHIIQAEKNKMRKCDFSDLITPGSCLYHIETILLVTITLPWLVLLGLRMRLYICAHRYLITCMCVYNYAYVCVSITLWAFECISTGEEGHSIAGKNYKIEKKWPWM